MSQILFGSDVPTRAYDLTTTGLDEYSGFSPADWRAINRGNAEAQNQGSQNQGSLDSHSRL